MLAPPHPQCLILRLKEGGRSWCFPLTGRASHHLPVHQPSPPQRTGRDPKHRPGRCFPLCLVHLGEGEARPPERAFRKNKKVLLVFSSQPQGPRQRIRRLSPTAERTVAVGGPPALSQVRSTGEGLGMSSGNAGDRGPAEAWKTPPKTSSQPCYCRASLGLRWGSQRDGLGLQEALRQERLRRPLGKWQVGLPAPSLSCFCGCRPCFQLHL